MIRGNFLIMKKAVYRVHGIPTKKKKPNPELVSGALLPGGYMY